VTSDVQYCISKSKVNHQATIKNAVTHLASVQIRRRVLVARFEAAMFLVNDSIEQLLEHLPSVIHADRRAA